MIGVQRRTSMHPLEEKKLNKKSNKTISENRSAHQTLSNENYEENPNRQVSSQGTMTDNQNIVRQSTGPSSSFFEGYSSVTSINSRYLCGRRINEKWKNLLVFMYTAPSIMFYSNVFLIVSLKLCIQYG